MERALSSILLPPAEERRDADGTVRGSCRVPVWERGGGEGSGPVEEGNSVASSFGLRDGLRQSGILLLAGCGQKWGTR